MVSRSSTRRFLLTSIAALLVGSLGGCAPSALLQSPNALPRGDWELAVGGGGAVTALEVDEREVEAPSFDAAWRIGVSDTSDVSVRAFYAGDSIGLYVDTKGEVLSGPVYVSPVVGVSAAVGLDGGSSVAISPGFMFGLEEIWAAPRAVVGTTSGEGLGTGFGVAVGSSLGDRVRVMPEIDLFYLPANFERPDLYLGFTIGVGYRNRSTAPEIAPPEPVGTQESANTAPTGLVEGVFGPDTIVGDIDDALEAESRSAAVDTAREEIHRFINMWRSIHGALDGGSGPADKADSSESETGADPDTSENAN